MGTLSLAKLPVVAALLGATKAKAAAPKAPKAAAIVAPTPFDPKPYKEPTVTQRMRESAKHAKVGATRDWVEGRISTAKHDTIHARANHVIKHGGRAKGKR